MTVFTGSKCTNKREIIKTVCTLQHKPFLAISLFTKKKNQSKLTKNKTVF